MKDWVLTDFATELTNIPMLVWMLQITILLCRIYLKNYSHWLQKLYKSRCTKIVFS